MFSDKLGEECGIFAGYSKNGDIAPHIKNGLLKLQHRGQESAGIATGDFTQTLHKNKGLVTEVFDDIAMKKLTGKFGIGHVRYSTQGGSNPVNAQPFLIDCAGGCVSIAHNGNVKKAMEIRDEFEKNGGVFVTSSDSEVLLRCVISDLKKPPDQWSFEDIGGCLKKDFPEGAYSLVFCLPNKVVAYRDPCGYRPLMLCEAKEGYFIASEDAAFDSLEVIKIVEIMPGEGVEITETGCETKNWAQCGSESKCVFEHIYFAAPASTIFGKNVYQVRFELGTILAKDDNIKPDIVVPVMESGFTAAIGYSRESGVPLETGLLCDLLAGRSFIQPTQEARVNKVREKFTPVRPAVEGKTVVLIDDSIVRGTTSTAIIKMLRAAGAGQMHVRLSSPMIVNTCSWGGDIPTKSELIAHRFGTEEEISRAIGADSVRYLNPGDLKAVFGESGWCYKCFMGDGFVY